MRVPSRRLPPLPVQPPSPLVKWECLGVLAAGVGMVLCLHPLGTVIVLGIMVPVGWLAVIADRRQRRKLGEKLVLARRGDPLCRFVRDFDCRAVDTWLIRATFEEVQDAYYGVTGYPIPVRAADRWKEDLRIDGEDLEDIGQHVAARAGYSMDDTPGNPLHGKVKTVGDLVAFLRHQPCTRAA